MLTYTGGTHPVRFCEKVTLHVQNKTAEKDDEQAAVPGPDVGMVRRLPKTWPTYLPRYLLLCLAVWLATHQLNVYLGRQAGTGSICVTRSSWHMAHGMAWHVVANRSILLFCVSTSPDQRPLYQVTEVGTYLPTSATLLTVPAPACSPARLLALPCLPCLGLPAFACVHPTLLHPLASRLSLFADVLS